MVIPTTGKKEDPNCSVNFVPYNAHYQVKKQFSKFLTWVNLLSPKHTRGVQGDPETVTKQATVSN